MNTLCPSCFLDQDGGEDDDDRHDVDDNKNTKRKGDAGDKESKTDKD